MPKNRGFSLIELLVGLALATLLGLAMLAMTRQFLQWNGNLGLLLERDEKTRQGPLLLGRHLAAAGNNRHSGSWSGVEVAAGELRLASDLTGEDGFPDGRLADSFESVALRGQDGQLQIRSGRAGFQPLLKNVRGFRVEDWSAPVLKLELVLAADRKLSGAGTDPVERVPLTFFVWNYRRNWFEERSPQ